MVAFWSQNHVFNTYISGAKIRVKHVIMRRVKDDRVDVLKTCLTRTLLTGFKLDLAKKSGN